MSFCPYRKILQAIRIVGEDYLLLKFRKEAHFRVIINIHLQIIYKSLTGRLLADLNDLLSHLDDTSLDITLIYSEVPLEGSCINFDGSI